MLDYSPALQQTYDFEATGHSILRTCVWVQVYAYGPPHLMNAHHYMCIHETFRHGGTVGSMCKMVKSLLPCPLCILSDWTGPSKAIFPKIKPRRGADGAE